MRMYPVAGQLWKGTRINVWAFKLDSTIQEPRSSAKGAAAKV